jgi:hypothetical protein
MKFGICKECIEEFPLNKESEVGEEIYECPKCFYPNGVKCGDFWETYEK